jgi:hypothetical protein
MARWLGAVLRHRGQDELRHWTEHFAVRGVGQLMLRLPSQLAVGPGPALRGYLRAYVGGVVADALTTAMRQRLISPEMGRRLTGPVTLRLVDLAEAKLQWQVAVHGAASPRAAAA